MEVSQSVNQMAVLTLVNAALLDKSSFIKAVEGWSISLSRVPDSLGGGYLLSSMSIHDVEGSTKRFSITPDGAMRHSEETVTRQGLVTYRVKPGAHEMLGILRSIQDTSRR